MRMSVAAARAVRAVRAVAARRRPQLADHLSVARRLVVAVVVVVGADVAGLLGAFLLGVESLQDGALNDLAARRVDRVSDVGVKLDAAVGVSGGAILVELAATLVAVASPEVILAAAARAAVGQLAAGHGDERALRPLDDFQIADD